MSILSLSLWITSNIGFHSWLIVKQWNLWADYFIHLSQNLLITNLFRCLWTLMSLQASETKSRSFINCFYQDVETSADFEMLQWFYFVVYGKLAVTELLSPFSSKSVVTQNNRLLHESDFKYCLSRPGRSVTFSKSVKLDIPPRCAPHDRGTRDSIIQCTLHTMQNTFQQL